MATPVQYFNVLDYGALGNGTHDDGPNFQSAFNAAASAGGGIVYAPKGTYKIATGVSLDCSNTTLYPNGVSSITMQGDGGATVILPVLGTTGIAFQVNYADLGFFIEDLNVLGDTSASNVVDCDYLFVGGYSFGPLRISRVLFAVTLAQHALVRGYGMEVHLFDVKFGGCGIVQSTDFGVVNSDNASGLLLEKVDFVDGASWHASAPSKVTGKPWVSIKDQAISEPERGSYVFHKCTFDEGGVGVRFNPSTSQRYGQIEINKCVFNQASYDFVNDRSIYIKQANTVRIIDSFIGYITVRTIGAELLDAGHVVIDGSCFDPIGRNADGNSANTIKIDSATLSVYVKDSKYALLDSACPNTQVENNGLVCRQRPATSTVTTANVLVKPSSTVGSVTPYITTDSPTQAIGVALENIQKATGRVVWPVAANITDGTTWAVTDQLGVTKNFWFKKPTNAPGGYVQIDISAATTGDQVKTAVLAAWAGAGLAMTAADHGAGTARTDFTATTYGESGNILLNSVSPPASGTTYVGMKLGLSRVLVCERSGQQVQIRSDGATTLAPGDALTSSATNGGHVKKTTTAGTQIVGRSFASVAATAEVLVDMIWHKDSI